MWAGLSSYLHMHDAPQVAATVEVRGDLYVDLTADGRVHGIERVGGPLEREDLVACLLAVPFGAP